MDIKQLIGGNQLIEKDVVDETEEVGEPVYDDDEEGDVPYGDDHETLVVHKSLLTPKGDFRGRLVDDQHLSHNLYNSR